MRLSAGQSPLPRILSAAALAGPVGKLKRGPPNDNHACPAQFSESSKGSNLSARERF